MKSIQIYRFDNKLFTIESLSSFLKEHKYTWIQRTSGKIRVKFADNCDMPVSPTTVEDIINEVLEDNGVLVCHEPTDDFFGMCNRLKPICKEFLFVD